MSICDLTIATGGPAMVKAAYSSGKPAYGVGAGNATMVIDETADIEEAARNTAHQQDQRPRLGLLGRRQPARRRVDLRRASSSSCSPKAATWSTTQEKQLLQRAYWDEQGRRTADTIARPAAAVAAKAGIALPADKTFLIVDRDAHRQAASVLDREARRRARRLQVPRLRRCARHGAADLRDRRQGPLVRHLLVRRRPHPSAGADGAGQPDHGAAGAVALECRHVHQRHADDVEHGLRRLGRQHHQREHLAQALHERDVGEPADSRRPAVGSRSCSASSTTARSCLIERDCHEHIAADRPSRVSPAPATRIASYLLTDYLERLGVEVIFGLCGHTVIGLLDALGKSRIRFVSTRHEQIAAHAADGYARATGKPGVVLTHLGPGLTNAATGVANAALDSIPMVVIAGDMQSYFYGRHPHQEVNLHQDADQFQIYRPFCKRVYRVDRVEDLPRIMERAFHLAQTGRPGPGARRRADGHLLGRPAGRRVSTRRRRRSPSPASIPATAARIVDALADAERPVLYAGGGVLSARATAELAALAEALEVPVAHTLMGKGCLHDDHPLLLGQTGFWGTPIANEKCRTADLIVAIGTRLAEANSSSWDPRFTFSIPPTRLIHIDADPAEIGRNYQTELGVVADAKLALAALAEAARRQASRGSRAAARGDRARPARSSRRTGRDQWSSDQFPLRPERILSELRKAAPEDGFIVTDVGWNKNGVGQQFPITVPGTFITPSGLATMGFGAGGGAGRQDGASGSAAVALVGDGGFSAQPVGDRDGDGSRTQRRLGGDGQRRVRHHRRSRRDALRHELRLPVRVRRQAVSRRLRGDGAVVRRRRRA